MTRSTRTRSVRPFVPASSLALLALPASAQCEGEWLPGAGIPGADQYVADAVHWDPDGAGPEPELLVIAGNFQVIGNQTARGLAGFDGTSWREIGVNEDGDIYTIAALAVYDGDLIVAGSFSTMGGIAANNVARFDGTTWHALGDGKTNGLTGSIGFAYGITMKVVGDRLVLGGFFDTAGGLPAPNVVAWNGTAFEPLGEGLSAGLFQEGVYSIAEHRGQIVVAGDYSQSGATPVSGVARFDGTSWSALGTLLDSFPFAVTVHRGRILAGAIRIDVSDPEALPECVVTAWDAGSGSWSPVGDSLGEPGFIGITRFVEFQGDLYAGGDFSEDPLSIEAPGRLSRLEGRDWVPVGIGGFTGFQPTVAALLVHGDELVVGGAFSRAGDVGASNLAAYDGTSWRAFAEGTSGWVTRFVEHQGGLVASGLFDSIEGVSAPRLARWDGTTWSPIGDGSIQFPAALGTYRGDLVISAFAEPGKLRRWDGTAFREFGEGIADEFGSVTAVAEFRGELIAGGNFAFTGRDGEEIRSLASWDGERWRGVGGGVAGKFFGVVGDLAVYRGDLIVAGPLVEAGGLPVEGIARWDGVAWSTLGEGLTGSDEVQVFVGDLEEFRGELVACGQFTHAGGVAARNVARWNGTSWSALGPDGEETLFGPASALATWRGDLYVGGQFAFAGGVPAHNVARWDGSSWSALGGGLDPNGFGEVDALIGHRDVLFAGGRFLHAEDEVSAYLARWGCD